MVKHKILIDTSDREKWSATVKMAAACAVSEAPGTVEIVILADDAIHWAQPGMAEGVWDFDGRGDEAFQ
jgi:hypothetical protein